MPGFDQLPYPYEPADDIARAAKLAESIDPAVQQGFDQSAVSIYANQYEAEFLRRGQSASEARSNGAFWAKLKVSDPTVIGPGDDPYAEYHARQGTLDNKIVADPISGVKDYIAGYRSSPVAATSIAAGPPTLLEPAPQKIFRSAQPVVLDRYSLNPGPEFFRQMLPALSFTNPEPQMFMTGPLPVATGSGLDPAVLRWVPWWARHSAATTDSRGLVLQMIEWGAEGPDAVDALQTTEGVNLLGAYLERVAAWAQTPLPDEAQGGGFAEIDEYINNLYGPGSDASD